MRHRRTRTSTGRSAWRLCMPSMPATRWQNEGMDANRIPEDVAAAIEECWPDGVIEEFDTDESYFHDIHAKLERDLRKIPGASLLWQTEAEDNSAHWDDDEDGEDDEPRTFRPITFSSWPHRAANSNSKPRPRTWKSRTRKTPMANWPLLRVRAAAGTVVAWRSVWPLRSRPSAPPSMPISRTAAPGHPIRAKAHTPMRKVNRSILLRTTGTF